MSICIQNVLGLFHEPERGFFTRKTEVYIAEGKITGIDKPPDGFTANRTIDGTGKLLIPGFINSHTHVPMTILRNTADDLKFHDWLFGRILPLEDKLTPEDCYWGTQLGIMEMLRTGTTCFLDMYFNIDEVARAVYDTKMRAVLSCSVMNSVEGVDGEALLKEAVELITRWRGKGNLDLMLAPHAAYTCDPEYQRLVAKTAKELDVGIHTHISESVREVEDIDAQYGKSPVALMAETGLLTKRTIAAHCVHLSDADILTLAEYGVHVAHNPISNLKLANGVAPVPKLRAAGVNVCLGTDGTASNNTLNMFGELKQVCVLHKGISGDPEAITASEGLELATSNGARALGLDEVIGKLEVGYDADLVLLSLDHPNMQPQNDLVSALTYAASGHEVELTMVKGEVLYENGTFPTIDTERVYQEVEQICKKIGLRN